MDKIKVSELEGDKLDYWVARAEGLAYSHDYHWGWGLVGPIIEREKISVSWSGVNSIGTNREWHSKKYSKKLNSVFVLYGATPLEAVKRCFVASKFGDEVDDPQPLAKPLPFTTPPKD